MISIVRTPLTACLAALLAVGLSSCLRLGLDPRATRGVSLEDGGADTEPGDARSDTDSGVDGDADGDGDGDGDGDADLDGIDGTDGDVDPEGPDATVPCEAGPCDETPCRLVAPQCGCCPGLVCQRPRGDDPYRQCVAPGPVAPYQACTINEDCTGGHVCVSATLAPGMCVPYCFFSSECPTHAECSEMIVADEPVGSCTIVCNPLTGEGCVSGTACIATNVRRKDDDAIVPGTLCGPDSMLPAEGDSCAGTYACQQGSTCVDDVCQRLCVMSSPSCPVSTSCGALAGGYSLGGVEYGTCR